MHPIGRGESARASLKRRRARQRFLPLARAAHRVTRLHTDITTRKAVRYFVGCDWMQGVNSDMLGDVQLTWCVNEFDFGTLLVGYQYISYSFVQQHVSVRLSRSAAFLCF